MQGVDQGIAHRCPVNILDAGHHEAHFARLQHIALEPLGGKYTDRIDLVTLADGFGNDLVALAQSTVFNPHQGHHAQVIIKPGVDYQRLQRRLPVALRGGNPPHQRFQRILDSQSRLGADQAGVSGIDADNLLDFHLDPLGVGLGQVHLVEYGQDFQPLLYRRIAIGDRLRLDTLTGVHHQQGALAGGEGARHLVGKIHVARRIDKVQLVYLPVTGGVVQRDALGLDGNAPLPLYVHGIEHLLVHFAGAQATTVLDKPVGQRGFSMVDMGDNGKIADVAKITHSTGLY